MSSIDKANSVDGVKALEGIIQTGSVSQNEFKTGSLPPDWIVEGNPIPRALSLTKAEDGLFSSGLWDCTAGTFYYTFPCDEIVHVIEGEVIVREDDKEYTLRPGDVAFFPQGMTCQWEIPNYLKKFAIYRSVSRTPLEKVLSRFKNLFNKKQTACLLNLKLAHLLGESPLLDLPLVCPAGVFV